MLNTRWFRLCIFAAMCSVAPPALAQAFDLSWSTVDGGGGTSVGGLFGDLELSGTLGQFDAAGASTNSLGVALVGGSWSASVQAPCPGDVNGDRIVNLRDLSTLLSHFGTQSGATPADGDFDGDGDVDLSDRAQLLSTSGISCS